MYTSHGIQSSINCAGSIPPFQLESYTVTVLYKVAKWKTILQSLKACWKGARMVKILEGLLYVLRQLLAVSIDGEKAVGFLSFDDVYDLICGFVDTKPYFHDHLLDKDHGLCVYIATICKKQFIILQNETTDIR